MSLDSPWHCAAMSEPPLVQSIIAISRYTRLGVIAEGVESAMQRDILVRLGCDGFQGYYFSHPLPEQAFRAWMDATRSLAS